MPRKTRLKIHERDGVQVLDMGKMEIWDGADLALLRDTLTKLFDVQHHRALGVDMTYVKYIPSGFFGMLFDFQEKGAAVRLYSPRPHVQNMLWFRQFFESESVQCHKMVCEPKYPLSIGRLSGWKSAAPWTQDPIPQVTPIFANDEDDVEVWELEEADDDAMFSDSASHHYGDE